jgi:hypothetical protein
MAALLATSVVLGSEGKHQSIKDLSEAYGENSPNGCLIEVAACLGRSTVALPKKRSIPKTLVVFLVVEG